MSISNSQLASDLGWDNAWEIPVANVENKQLSSQLAQKTKEKEKIESFLFSMIKVSKRSPK